MHSKDYFVEKVRFDRRVKMSILTIVNSLYVLILSSDEVFERERMNFVLIAQYTHVLGLISA